MIHNKETIPQRPAPKGTIGPIAWLRGNLFNGPINSIFTLLGLYVLYLLVVPTVQWAFIDANWVGDSREDSQFMYGLYPSEEYWRANIVFAMFAGIIAWMVIPRLPFKRWMALFALLIFPVIAYVLLHGGYFDLPRVSTHRWGGLMLTLLLASVGMIGALPIGIVLALGRRSNMPIVKTFCVIFIEFWRGVPLITILFMASVMLPLFLPSELSVDRLVRALIGLTLFQSAYMAEVIRGGLQAIPKGQDEAAAALGMTYWKRMGLIVMPQALKMMIPGIVNTFISLFKDTTLVMIIGLFDLLGIVQAALSDSRWLGFSVEGYVFAAFVFWIFCFSMSRYSQYLERKLNTGHKH